MGSDSHKTYFIVQVGISEVHAKNDLLKRSGRRRMLNFSLSKQQQMIKKEVAKLVKDLVVENAHDMDENAEIPAESIQKAWELGVSVSAVDEKYGGFGMEDSPLETSLVLEELAYGDMAF